MKISIFVPLYNENKGILQLKKDLLPTLKKLKDLGYSYELILVDDGSTDDTNKLLKSEFKDVKNVKIIKHKVNQNLGGAHRTAIKAATGDYLLGMDSDCTYKSKDLFPMLELIQKENASVVIGSPFHPKGKIDGIPAWRLIPSRSASLVYQILTRSHVRAYTGIFKLYKLTELRKIKIESDGYLAITEILIKLLKKRLKVIEYPVTVGVRKFNDSKMKFINTTKQHLNLMGKIISGKI